MLRVEYTEIRVMESVGQGEMAGGVDASVRDGQLTRDAAI